MGAEGNISVARVASGEFLISADLAAPQFVVRRPVVVLPVHGRRIKASGDAGGAYLHRCIDREPSADAALSWGADFGVAETDLVLLGDFAIIVASRSCFSAEREAQWRAGDGPGGEPIAELEAAWGKIIPGRWVVLDYYDSEGAAVSYSPPNGVVLEEPVKWEIWT